MLEELQELGLSQKEAQIYVTLAKLGEATGNEVAKETSSHRTVAYNILQQLIDKGLVNYVNKDKKRFFSISDPESLLVEVKEKEELANNLIKSIQKIKTVKRKFSNVEVYEGVTGMKIIFNELKKAKELRVLNATGKAFEYLIYSAEHVVKEMIRSSKPRVIATQSMKNTELNKYKKLGMKVKYLPKEAENDATTFIFDDRVVIQMLKGKPLLIVIENKEIYEGYKKDFDVFWTRL